MRLAGRIVTGVLLLSLAACATRTPVPTRSSSPAVTAAIPAPTEVPLATTPERYLARAASYDLLMLEAGRLADARSADERLRGLARSLAEDHRGLAGQLSMNGRRLNLLPSPVLLPNHQQWLAELGAAADFDAGYRRLVRRVHQNSFHMHNAFARQGSSPTLRLVARNAAEAERRHWAEIAR